MSVRGQTLERVEARIYAVLAVHDDRFETREGLVSKLAREALRALVCDEDGREDVATELICLGANEPCSVGLMFKATIGEVLRYDASQGVDSPELTDEQLSRLRPARGPGEPREGTLESVIDVRNDNGSAIRVSFANGRGEAWFKLVEIEGDPRHGLTEEQWAFKETLREAFTAGQSMTFEFDGRKFTGVRIASFTTEA
jgi:hypothetical protein